MKEPARGGRSGLFGRRRVVTLAALAPIAVALTVIAGCHSSQQSASSSPASPAPATQAELPFTGLAGPKGVAVDAAGAVYVTDNKANRVVELPSGFDTQVELPFTGLKMPFGIAVDGGGNVYVADYSPRVLKLPPGSNAPVELPFVGLKEPGAQTAGEVAASSGARRPYNGFITSR